MSHGTLEDLEIELAMVCQKCGRKIVLLPDKWDALMNGGLCPDCIGYHDDPLDVKTETKVWGESSRPDRNLEDASSENGRLAE